MSRTRKKANGNRSMQGKQGRKDSTSKRENLDNVRIDKLKEIEDSGDDKAGKGYSKPKPCSSKPNDLSWYAKNPEMLEASSHVTFGTIIGSGFQFDNRVSYIPGVMAISWMPTIGGVLEAGMGALQQAANSTYSYLVHANSRNYSYEPADLMMMILGGANVFSLLSAMIRAFGTIQFYDEPNMYKPDGILKAMGFNADNLRLNLSTMWWDINELINRTKQIWIPMQ